MQAKLVSLDLPFYKDQGYVIISDMWALGLWILEKNKLLKIAVFWNIKKLSVEGALINAKFQCLDAYEMRPM
jgi:hypothetical protein